MGTNDGRDQGAATGKNSIKPLKVSNEPFDDGMDSESAGLGGVARKLGEVPWFKKNPNIVKAFLAGGLMSVFLLVVGWQLGWFNDGPASSTSSPSLQVPIASGPGAPGSLPSSVPATPAAPVALTPVTTLAPPSPASAPATTQSPSGIVAIGAPAILNPVSPTAPPATDAAKPQAPSLPSDVSKWKKADFYRARKENDPKLSAAITYLGETFVGSTPAAQGLTELLKPLPALSFALPPAGTPSGTAPPPAVPTAPNERPYTPADHTKHVETVIEALGRNGSELARKTLEQVLSGEFATDDDKAAVVATLKTLLAHPNPEHDALLLRVLTAPAELRHADREGPWPAKELQTKAFELVKPGASIDLRSKIAESLVSRSMKFDSKDPAFEFLLASDPRNCGAQFVFYERADLPKETKTILEQQLADYSSKALAKYLGIPDDASAGSPASLGGAAISSSAGVGVAIMPVAPIVTPAAPSIPAAPSTTAKTPTSDPVRQSANELWADKFRSSIESRLGKVATFEKQPQLVLLGAAIPHDSTRAAMARVFKKHWSEGPKALEAAGAIDRYVTDPGMILLVKSFPRREQKSPRSAGKSGLSTPATSSAPKLSEAVQKKVQAEQEWMDFSSKLVVAWCNRLAAAAEAKTKGDGKDKKPEAKAGDAKVGDAEGSDGPVVEVPDAAAATDAKLPAGFAMHPDARVTAAFHLTWPADASPELGTLAPGWLDLYFVRAEQMSKPKKAAAYYGRQAQAKAAEVRTIEKTTWIDTVRLGSQKDRRRSIDIRITKGSSASAETTDADNETDLTVEVLIVEIKDPMKD